MLPHKIVLSRDRLGVLALLAVAGVLIAAFDLRPLGLLVVGAGFGLAGRGIAAAIVPARTRLDRLIAAVTFAFACLAVVAEALSLAVLLGSPTAWMLAAVACGIVGGLLPNREPTGWRDDRPWLASTLTELGLRPEDGVTQTIWQRTGTIVSGVLAVGVALHLALTFALTFFSGITVGDSITHYLPRSIRFLQYGTFGIFETYYDFMQYFHQTLVAVQLLFLRSDALVNPMSFVFASLMSLGVYALARSLKWPAPYPLFAALVPLSMPILLLHASTSNFDTLVATWLVFALYFLRRGYATSDRGWLIAAGAATALMFASKPTSWFAMPGLGLVWLATLWRAYWRGRLRRTIPTFAVCAVILALVGMPFLLRNVISRGYLVASPEWQSFQLGGSAASGPGHRLRLLEFNTLALGLQLVTPPFLLSASFANSLDPWFTARAQALGFRLPDLSITVHADWPGLIRHVSHRYDSNHAGLGAAFVLVTLPSLLAVPFARRRLGRRWIYAIGLEVVGLCYFVVLNTVSIYSVNNIRYLIEMMAVVAALGPCLFVLLPPRIGGTLALAVSTLLLFEMHDIYVNNKQVPPDLVMRIPRAEQYYVVNGNPPTAARAAALLDQKYPPDQVPELWIEDSGTPTFQDYTFLGPSLQRRTHYLKPPQSPADLPGPYVTQDRGLAERLMATGQVVGDQLEVDYWILFPNDQPRVLFWSYRSPETGQLMLRLQASAPPGMFRDPRFGLTLRANREERLRAYEPSPIFDIPMDVAARGTLQVEMRDGDDTRRVERIRINRAQFMGI